MKVEVELGDLESLKASIVERAAVHVAAQALPKAVSRVEAKLRDLALPSVRSWTAKVLSPADREWGYPFGCDGLMSLKQTAAFISRSEQTVRNLIARRAIRKGKGSPTQQGNVVIYRRSVQEWMRTLEC